MAVKFLVDVNVLSETIKVRPEPSALQWLKRHESEIAVNTVILGELEYGILILPIGRRRSQLWNWYSRDAAHLQVVEMGRKTAEIWARLLADLKRKGRTMPAIDSLIAASAIEYGLIVATRNTSDYRFCGVGLTNPFES